MMINAVIQDTQTRDAQLVQTTEPVCPNGGAVLKMQACGLCGTDVDKLMQGKPQSILGHEFVGTIEKLSPEAQAKFPHYKLGQRLAVAHHVPCQTCYYCKHNSPSMCRQFKSTNFTPGGFAEKIAVTDLHLAHTTFILKESITDAEGCLIEPLSCCLRAVDRVDARLGKNLLVVGLGSFGLLSLMSAQYRGYNAMGFDINAERVEITKKELNTSKIFFEQTKLEKMVADSTNDIGLDAVILSVVNLKTIELALALVRDGGQIILLASTQNNQPLIDQNQLYYREINIISSYSPSLIHLKEANDLVQNRLLPLQFLTNHQYPLSQFNQALQDYQQAKIIKAILSHKFMSLQTELNLNPTLPRTYQAMVYYAPHDIRLETIGRPELLPGEVLIKIEKAVTNGTDLKAFLRGHPVLLKTLPSYFGHEAVGHVVAKADDVMQFEIGNRVVPANSAPCETCKYCKNSNLRYVKI